jgi:hypothetical protein
MSNWQLAISNGQLAKNKKAKAKAPKQKAGHSIRNKPLPIAHCQLELYPLQLKR